MFATKNCIVLNGEYDDYSWGYGQNPLSIIKFHYQLVPLIRCSAIAKTILDRTVIFVFLHMWKINL